jgi:sensory rhodopsin
VNLQAAVQTTFTLVFIAFCALAFFLFLEKDRVPERFRTILRVSIVYLSIAAVNYGFMREMYGASVGGDSRFPTSYRYIDWVLTTPLMLVKFPLLLGVGPKGRAFIMKLVVLDLVMIVTGWIGELYPSVPLVHYGFFLVGCGAWFGALVLLFIALSTLPDNVPEAVRSGVRTMGLFVLVGWAVYPVGYLMPLLGVPADLRELVYNVADLGNKGGLCLLVYITAKRSAEELGSGDEVAA